MKHAKFQTVRCILMDDSHRFFMVVHNNFLATNHGKWGLPGGRIEYGEEFVQTITREIHEELAINITELHEVGDYEYKRRRHKVFAAHYSGRIEYFDPYEILEVGWHTLNDIRALATAGKLHTGFELQAILDHLDTC